MITYRQNVDKVAEQQQTKYLDLYTILPSEISMQLAEVSLALGAIEDQVPHHLLLPRIYLIYLMCLYLYLKSQCVRLSGEIGGGLSGFRKKLNNKLA